MAKSLSNLIVRKAHPVSPSMHLVTLGGDDLRHFPRDKDGGYIKLILESGGFLKKSLMRTYTIREQREDELDVLFALHGGNAAGPATGWALNAKPGDAMQIRGVGDPKPLPEGRDFYLIAGDMSALPAIAVNLERMDRSAKGIAALEIQHPDDAVAIDAPDGIELKWIVNPEPGLHPDLLADALRSVELPEGTLAGWAACEFSGMRKLRAFLRDELGLGPRDLYISSYWKHGLNEGEHKLAKRKDAMFEAA